MILSKVSIYCFNVIRELYREKKVGKSSTLVIPTMWLFQKQVKSQSDTFRFQIYDFVIKTAQLYTYSNVVAALQACAVSFRYYCYRNDDVYKNTAQLCTYRAVLTCHFNYGYMIMSKTCNSSIIAFGKRFCQQCVVSVCIVFGMMLLSIMCHSCIYCFRNDAFVKNESFLHFTFSKCTYV